MVTYPNDWDESKLLDHVSLVQGLTYTPENVKPTGTLVLRSSNIQNGRLSLDDNVYVNAHVPEEKIVAKGDILVCVRNGSSALIGKSCVLPELKCTTFGAFMSVLRGDATGYFAKLFESNIVQEQVRGRSNATINQITKKDFQSILVTVPDKPEQEEIARTLSQFDSYIDDLAELIEKKKGIRDGALEDLMSRKTRLVNLSDEWEDALLSDICKIYDGTHQTPKYTLTGVRFVSVENIADLHGSNKYISFEAYQSDFKVYPEKGDILMTRIGDIGTPNVVETDEPLAYYVSLALFKNITVNSRFLHYYIMSSAFQKELDDRNLHHATPKKINKGEIGKCKVAYPKDKKEQEAIAEILTAMDKEIADLETEREKMIQIREGAMDDLLTGRVRLTK